MKKNATLDDIAGTKNNGPHHDAKWARRLLNSPTQTEYRRQRLAAGEKLHEAVARSAFMNYRGAQTGRFTERGLSKILKQFPTK